MANRYWLAFAGAAGAVWLVVKKRQQHSVSKRTGFNLEAISKERMRLLLNGQIDKRRTVFIEMVSGYMREPGQLLLIGGCPLIRVIYIR